MSTNVTPEKVQELQTCVVENSRVIAQGSGTKNGLSSPASFSNNPPLDPPKESNVIVVDMTRFAGIVEYEPTEFVVTVQAGTRIQTINQALDEHGQYLPFDPPLVDRGATIGGTVAAGLSGSGRLLYGGLRDFILGVRFVDGEGELVYGGGRVVKNAAGFDLPKLMVGSGGRLGIMTELTFKVFPQPARQVTLRCEFQSLEATIAAVGQLMSKPMDIQSLDIHPSHQLWIQLAGEPTAIEHHVKEIQSLWGGNVESVAAASETWQSTREFNWLPDDTSLIKLATTCRQLVALDLFCKDHEVERRYCVAGNVAWLAWPNPKSMAMLDEQLKTWKLAGTIVCGKPDRGQLGHRPTNPFAARLKQALDGQNRFGDLR